MPKVTIVRKQHAKLPDAIKGPSCVKVGFPEGSADQGNISKAIWNEFGTNGGGWGGTIPERPFMRNAMRDNAGKYKDALATSAKKLMRGETSLSTVMQKLGNVAQDDIKSEITALSSPPNSPVTVALKGSSNPLINTGEMLGSVRFKVDNS